MKLSDLNELDFKNIGNWPMPAKAGAVGIICATVLFLGYWFDTKEQLDVLARAEQKEQELKQTFETKQRAAAGLDAYRKQMEEIKTSFGALLRELPSKTEVADLLVDISRVGITSGLEFEIFKPEAEIPKEFYAELPIQIRVRGDFHRFGAFAAGISALPRIVTLHNLTISENKDKTAASTHKLIMEATAKTYRYLDEKEVAAATATERKKKSK